MSKYRVTQGVSGNGNQTAGSADALHQTNNNQSINLEVHLSLPHGVAYQVMHIHISLEGQGGGDGLES